VWFSVVYLGQHYVADVLGGIAFALGAWLIMTQILAPMVPALRPQPAAAVPADFDPVPSEPSSADLDPAEQART
jgi:membrane-associated phospholipid phosphatase